MELGYLLESGDPMRGRRATQWVAGAPESSFWMGLDLRDRPVLTITTYRCPHCGYLESYAQE
jgi:hypothetical protein